MSTSSPCTCLRRWSIRSARSALSAVHTRYWLRRASRIDQRTSRSSSTTRIPLRSRRARGDGFTGNLLRLQGRRGIVLGATDRERAGKAPGLRPWAVARPGVRWPLGVVASKRRGSFPLRTAFPVTRVPAGLRRFSCLLEEQGLCHRTALPAGAGAAEGFSRSRGFFTARERTDSRPREQRKRP